MADAVVTGLQEITDALKSMPDKMLKSTLRSAVRAGANEVKNAIKANAPVDTGKLQKSIKVKASRGTKDTIIFKVKRAFTKNIKMELVM